VGDDTVKPTQAPTPTRFDRFASATAGVVARPWFFASCLLTIVVWAPTILWFEFDTWQLLINTWTTLITYLLVALLQNTQSRDARALHRKLNAIADALGDLIEAHAASDASAITDVSELREAVGLEHREGT
jgi:low affinity Fe/Cu permease